MLWAGCTAPATRNRGHGAAIQQGCTNSSPGACEPSAIACNRLSCPGQRSTHWGAGLWHTLASPAPTTTHECVCALHVFGGGTRETDCTGRASWARTIGRSAARGGLCVDCAQADSSPRDHSLVNELAIQEVQFQSRGCRQQAGPRPKVAVPAQKIDLAAWASHIDQGEVFVDAHIKVGAQCAKNNLIVSGTRPLRP